MISKNSPVSLKTAMSLLASFQRAYTTRRLMPAKLRVSVMKCAPEIRPMDNATCASHSCDTTSRSLKRVPRRAQNSCCLPTSRSGSTNRHACSPKSQNHSPPHSLTLNNLRSICSKSYSPMGTGLPAGGCSLCGCLAG